MQNKIALEEHFAKPGYDRQLGAFIVRSAPRPAATLALRAAGVALPPTIRDAAVS